MLFLTISNLVFVYMSLSYMFLIEFYVKIGSIVPLY